MSTSLPTHPWVHVTPVANKNSILARGLLMSGSDGVTRNYDTGAGTIYLADSPEGALRWAKEIANRRGQAETYALFAVSLGDLPNTSWGGVGRTKFGPQAVVRHWNIPAANLIHLDDVEIKPRRGAKFDFTS